MRIRYALLIAILSFSACTDPEGAVGDIELPDAISDRIAVTSLAGTVLLEGDLLELPSAISLVDSALVILDAYADAPIVVIRSKDGKFLGSLGGRGEGPGEFRSVWRVDPVPGADSRFWVYDFRLRRFTQVDLERDLKEPERLVRAPMVTLAEAVTVNDAIWVDSLIVALGFFDDGRMGIFRHGRLREVVGPSPPGSERIPVRVRQHAYQSMIATRPDRSQLALATRHADRLEIYQPNGELLVTAQRPIGFEPRFEVRRGGNGQPVMATDDDLRFGFIALTATADHIWAVFSGRTRAEFPGRANFGEFVYMFNWSGELLHKLHLDNDVIAIAVDPSETTILAVRHEPAPAVLRYDLPRVR